MIRNLKQQDVSESVYVCVCVCVCVCVFVHYLVQKANPNKLKFCIADVQAKKFPDPTNRLPEN